MLARAGAGGARRALSDVGLGGKDAVLTIHDLLECIRLVRRTAVQTAVQVIATGAPIALLTRIAMTMRPFGPEPSLLQHQPPGQRFRLVAGCSQGSGSAPVKCAAGTVAHPFSPVSHSRIIAAPALSSPFACRRASSRSVAGSMPAVASSLACPISQYSNRDAIASG